MNEHTVGIDVGGTKIAAALIDSTGTLSNRCDLGTPLHQGRQGVLDTIEKAARSAMAGHPVTAVGIGTGGVVDSRTGTIVSATDLLPDWAGCPVGPHLADRLGTPAYVDNDVNALAMGELVFGSAHRTRTALYTAVGTGIGGALVVDGALRHGPHHSAGGIGHLPAGGQRLCSCGRPGHLESIASGPAITAAYRDASGESTIDDLRQVVLRSRDGDPVAGTVLTDAATTLGRTLAGATNLLDPDLVIVGGGVCQIGEPFWHPLREAFRAELLPPVREVPIEPAELGPNASVVGAAALARTPRSQENKR